MLKSRLSLAIAIALTAGLALTACGDPNSTPEDKVKANVSKGVHALTPDERQRAEINAKQFFNKGRIEAGGAVGQFNECKPSDSNFNGLVSCYGMVPQPNGTYKETVRYCGYTPELVGCSPEDTVAK